MISHYGVHCNLTGPYGIFNVTMAFCDIFITCVLLLGAPIWYLLWHAGLSLAAGVFFFYYCTVTESLARLKRTLPAFKYEASRHPIAEASVRCIRGSCGSLSHPHTVEWKRRQVHSRTRAHANAAFFEPLQSFDSYLLSQV